MRNTFVVELVKWKTVLNKTESVENSSLALESVKSSSFLQEDKMLINSRQKGRICFNFIVQI